MFGYKKGIVFLMNIRGTSQEKYTVGTMSITTNTQKRAKCKICGKKILDDYIVCVDNYITRRGSIIFFYYHVDCIRRLISIVP
jgi:hypothetical protein